MDVASCPTRPAVCADCAQALADFIVYLHEPPKPLKLRKASPSVVGLAMPDAKTERPSCVCPLDVTIAP